MTLSFLRFETIQSGHSPGLEGGLHRMMGASAVGEDVVFVRGLMIGMTEQIGDQRHHVGIVIDEAGCCNAAD